VNETGVQVNFSGVSLSGTSSTDLVQRVMNVIGTFQFQVTVTDSEGNSVQNLTQTIKVESGELPNITFINLTSEGGEGQVIFDIVQPINRTLNNLTRTNDTTPTFRARTQFNAFCGVVDNNANINYSDILLGNILGNCSTTGGTSHICTLPDGNATGIGVSGFSIGCQNLFGDQFSESAQFFQVNITDGTPPNITLNFPLNNSFFQENINNTIAFNWTVTDNFDLNFTCISTIDGVVKYTNTTFLNGTDGTFTDTVLFGQHNWSVECTDSFNNVDSKFHNFMANQ